MAKKKQFAGKKTKLAELPLTRALEQKAGDEAAWAELQTAADTSSRQLILSLERSAAADTAGPLASAYFQVLQELTLLQADLETNPSSPPATPDSQPLPANPLPRNLEQALRQAREGLQDLHRLLSE